MQHTNNAESFAKSFLPYLCVSLSDHMFKALTSRKKLQYVIEIFKIKK